MLTWYTGEPTISKSTIVISGAETLQVHMMILLSVDCGFTTTEASSLSTIFFFFDRWRRSQGFSRLIMMLHWVPPSLISVSALTDEIGWCRGRIPITINNKFPQQIQKGIFKLVMKIHTHTNITPKNYAVCAKEIWEFKIPVFCLPKRNKFQLSWKFCFYFGNYAPFSRPPCIYIFQSFC